MNLAAQTESEAREGGPDFICIGLEKAGTGWLFDQLQYHPDFWMPPVKELRYLNRSVPRMKKAARLLKMAERSSEKLERWRAQKGAKPWDERDYAFLRQIGAHQGEPMSLDFYASLFRHKGQLLSGDITPGYSALDGQIIAEIANRLPAVKIILLVRDPVARAWSSICMGQRHGKFDVPPLLENPDRFRAFLEGSTYLQDRSFPSQLVRRWREYAPSVQFRSFLFDDIETQPHHARREILQYLGADPEKSSGEIPADHNRKATAEKLALPEAIRNVLVEHFREELHACASEFGPKAQAWMARYGV
jgi:Sulfotransferase family